MERDALSSSAQLISQVEKFSQQLGPWLDITSLPVCHVPVVQLALLHSHHDWGRDTAGDVSSWYTVQPLIFDDGVVDDQDT